MTPGSGLAVLPAVSAKGLTVVAGPASDQGAGFGKALVSVLAQGAAAGQVAGGQPVAGRQPALPEGGATVAGWPLFAGGEASAETAEGVPVAGLPVAAEPARDGAGLTLTPETDVDSDAAAEDADGEAAEQDAEGEAPEQGTEESAADEAVTPALRGGAGAAGSPAHGTAAATTVPGGQGAASADEAAPALPANGARAVTGGAQSQQVAAAAAAAVDGAAEGSANPAASAARPETAAAPRQTAAATAAPEGTAPVSAPSATAPTPASQPAAAPAPAQAVPQQPLTTQVATPLLTLATARTGEHVMTIQVTPENLGPVTVRATVTADGVSVELFAPNDAAREALRTILPDLRRDLAASGLANSELDLSADDEPEQSATPEQDPGTPQQPARPGVPTTEIHATIPAAPLAGTTTTLDILA